MNTYALRKYLKYVFKYFSSTFTQILYKAVKKLCLKLIRSSSWNFFQFTVHPNVKLFISHGGISGVYEAVHAGVPVLGFPLFYDQPRNVANLVDSGMAIAMDLSSVSKDSFLKNVLELVNNEKYKRLIFRISVQNQPVAVCLLRYAKNAEIASKRFKDLPMTPAQSVVYWTEYVVRHKGASHLNSHAFNSTWYQYFMLDVVGTVLITCLTVLFLIRVILKVIFFMMKSLKKKK